jgi:hypothetical protein
MPASPNAKPRKNCDKMTPEFAPGSQQHAPGHPLGDLADGLGHLALQLAARRVQRQRHIGAGVAVRHRKYV